MFKNEIIGAENIVAPLAGAWIEIATYVGIEFIDYGRSPRGSVD